MHFTRETETCLMWYFNSNESTWCNYTIFWCALL